MAQLQVSSCHASSTPTETAYTTDSDEEDNLPYPTELPRSAFLAEAFSPQTYLASLRNRHQTLEDLRSDLRFRSQLLNQELLDLVNGKYEEFLSLGQDLRGGEGKVEGIRVGLLGFQREVEGVWRAVEEGRVEVEGLLREKGEGRKDIVVGRALLEVDARLGELERALGVVEGEEEDDELDDEDDDMDDGEVESSGSTLLPQLRRLQRHTEQYIILVQMVERIGPSHPFLQAHRPRLAELRKTLLLDLATALRQAKKDKAADDLLAIVRLYGDLGAERDSVRVLKGV
ncbi:hypothetical protein LTR62_008560 [Meristemomyces frigidus]|uniref:Conserved oligomeric Golgi complex subunit 2 n=1 Tax=Meristemomyces frigidus TaxID=1508187 RepID=A0AAN7TUN3_9PEZI|nr:hypothetical protein LTR62_008560 [Meristemomyces frigidus]